MPDLAATDPRTRQIVDAAYALLDETGLDALTIRAVLARSGLSRRAVYDRFDGKDALMLAVFEHTIALAVETFAAHLETIARPLDRLHFIVTAIVHGRDMVTNAPPTPSRLGAAMSREHLRLAEAHPEALARALAPLIGLIAAQIAAAMAAGAARDGDPERMATLIYNLVSTTVHKELLAGETRTVETDRGRLAEELWAFCHGAIAR